MSIEATSSEPKLSKEEKKQRKEEKRAKKAAKAAAASASASTPDDVPTAGPSTTVSPVALANDTAANETLSKEEKKKRKEEKKRKRAAEITFDTPAAEAVVGSTATTADQPKKKSKKDKKDKAAESSDVPEPTPSTSVSIPTTFLPEHTAYLTAQGITLSPSLYPPILSIPALPVSPSIQTFLQRFKQPTPIQACAWPPLLAGRDVVGVAETGSGKTLGFGVPGLQFLSTLSITPEGGKKKKNKKGGAGVIQLLVLAPTRELALQSHETLSDLGKAMGIESVCLFGGVGKDSQLAALAKGETRIVVGTPGRVLDLADSGDMDLST